MDTYFKTVEELMTSMGPLGVYIGTMMGWAVIGPILIVLAIVGFIVACFGMAIFQYLNQAYMTAGHGVLAWLLLLAPIVAWLILNINLEWQSGIAIIGGAILALVIRRLISKFIIDEYLKY